MSEQDIIWLVLLIPFFWGIGRLICSWLNLSGLFSNLLYIWHTVLSFTYYLISLFIGADANEWFIAAKNAKFVWEPGTAFITSLTSVLVQHLNLGILACYIVFGFFGYIGILLFTHLLAIHLPSHYKLLLKKNLVYVIVFMPSLGYWSSSIGKDAPSFFACCLTLFASGNINKRYLLFIVAVLIQYMIRPHVAACMLFAMSISILLSSDVNIFARSILGILVIAGSILIIPYVLNFADLNPNSNYSSVVDYMIDRQNYNQEGAGGYNLKSMPLYLQLFSYLFRPFPFEAKNVQQMIASLENSIIFLIFLAYVRKIVLMVLKGNDIIFRYSFFFVCLMWYLLATTTANLGIASRQKTMFLPALFVLLVYAMGEARRLVSGGDKNLRWRM
ncbi:conserved membrane hypothetical protein [Gammaproteobacteria bacterium]